MRKLILLCSFLPCVVLLAGCPKKGDTGADAAAEAAATPAEASADLGEGGEMPAAPSAKNEKDIARFPGETKVANEPAKILSYAVVRASPRAGANVAVPHVGSDVTKIAQYNDAFLIVFPDPKDASSSLMGWVGKEAFVATITDASVNHLVVDASKPLTCGAGLALVTLGGAEPVCKKTCKTDKDCKTPTAGACGVAAAATGANKAVHVCLNE